jgi:hypothetical protein
VFMRESRSSRCRWRYVFWRKHEGGPERALWGLAHLVVVDCFISLVFVFCASFLSTFVCSVSTLYPDCSPHLNERRA